MSKYEYRTIINAQGDIMLPCVLIKDEVIQNFELQEGQQAVQYLNKSQVVNEQNVEYLKPQWNGSEWIETATINELNEAYPSVTSTPTTEERMTALENAISALMEV